MLSHRFCGMYIHTVYTYMCMSICIYVFSSYMYSMYTYMPSLSVYTYFMYTQFPLCG